MGGRTTPVALGIKLIAPIRRDPAHGMLHTLASVSRGTVAMIPGQRLSRQEAGSTSQVISCLLVH